MCKFDSTMVVVIVVAVVVVAAAAATAVFYYISFCLSPVLDPVHANEVYTFIEVI